MEVPLNTTKFRCNVVGFIGEGAFFYLGMIFASKTTVLPGFVSHLIPSARLLVLTLAEGAWRLRQLFVTYWLSPKRKKKPYLSPDASHNGRHLVGGNRPQDEVLTHRVDRAIEQEVSDPPRFSRRRGRG